LGFSSKSATALFLPEQVELSLRKFAAVLRRNIGVVAQLADHAVPFPGVDKLT